MNTTTPPSRYKHYRFPPEIISHGVWLYYRFCLSYRNVEIHEHTMASTPWPAILPHGRP